MVSSVAVTCKCLNIVARLANLISFVCATPLDMPVTVRFRDYERSDLGAEQSPSVVNAACATSAATTFFDAVKIDGCKYRDGGFRAKNPVDEVWQEAQDVWLRDENQKSLSDELNCFVSIGTGHLKINEMKESLKDFLEAIIALATQTTRSDDDFKKSHRDITSIGSSQKFFRFNIEQGLQEVELRDHDKLARIQIATRSYMTSPSQTDYVSHCAKRLRDKKSAFP